MPLRLPNLRYCNLQGDFRKLSDSVDGTRDSAMNLSHKFEAQRNNLVYNNKFNRCIFTYVIKVFLFNFLTPLCRVHNIKLIVRYRTVA